MTEANGLNAQTVGIVGNTGTAFTGTAVTNHAVIVGGATSSTLTSVGPSATAGQILRSGGASADPSYSTATYPSTAGTSGKVLISDGTNIVSSTPTFPNASATSRKIIVSDGTNWVASTETWATPGTSGNILTSDGTNWTSAAPATTGGGLGTTYIYDDFLGIADVASNKGVGNTNIPTSIGSSTQITSIDASGNPGIIALTVTSTFTECVIGSLNGITAGAGTITMQWVCKIPTLSTATNRFITRIGLMNTFVPAGTTPTKGCWFEGVDNVNSGNWTINSAGAATTSANTSTAMDTNWHNYKIVINAANTSVAFYIDNVQVANSPIATNLPNAAFGPQINANRTAGSGGSVYADLYILQISLTSARPG